MIARMTRWKYVFLLLLLLSTSAEFSNFNHTLVWKGPMRTGLDQSLTSNLEKGDFFYLFLGDTQYYFPCTSDNAGCLAHTPDCKQPLSDACIERQSKWSNKYQQTSIRTLIDHLQSVTNHLPKGLIINGDLTETGYRKELDEFLDEWDEFDPRFPMYPGLGNHDYFNNVDDCSSCADRMVKYFIDYVTRRVSRKVDISEKTMGGKLIGTGSLAYSWDECNEQGCFHFTQQNNFPTYVQKIATNSTTWNIQSSLSWLVDDLNNQTADVPTILNLHDFDTSFTEAAKAGYKHLISSSRANILAVFFAHLHERIGLKSYWCKDGRPIWLLYSGSVPGNNYILAHLSPAKKTIKNIYKVHVANESTSFIELEALKHSCNHAAGRVQLFISVNLVMLFSFIFCILSTL